MRGKARLLAAVLVLGGVVVSVAGASHLAVTTRVSVASSGAQADGPSFNAPAFSGDGRFVAFASTASNLVPGDTNSCPFALAGPSCPDIFVRDRIAGTTKRVSVSSDGGQANGPSLRSAISADGRLVAFDSLASNLVPGDTNGQSDVFVHDRTTGATERVSVSSAGGQAGGFSFNPSLSADGRFVAFNSDAPDLVPGDTNGAFDIFVRDRLMGTTERVSVSSSGVQGDDDSALPNISGDGRFVVFSSRATTLVAEPTNGVTQVYVHDRLTGETALVSVNDAGQAANGFSFNAGVSADGRFIAFVSDGDNLVPGDTNGVRDVFVRDRAAGTTTRVNVSSASKQANGFSNLGFNGQALSADGRFVAFSSLATNLVPGDTNGAADVFVHDLQTGITTRASVDSAGGQSNGPSGAASISPSGRLAGFVSAASNLVPGDTNGVLDTFVHDDAGAAGQIEDLIAFVESLGLQRGIETSLVAKLQDALDALAAGDTATACTDLQDFENEVAAQAGKKITSEQAAELTATADEIRALLGC